METAAAAEVPDEPGAPAPRPVVLLLLDGWGIAPASEANAITSAKIPTFSKLVKEYPVALISVGSGRSLNLRYLSLGSGCDCSDENAKPAMTLTAAMAAAKKRQSKIAETERFAALTNFFNGHVENRFSGETWKIISSEAGDKTIKPQLALRRAVKEIIRETEAQPPLDLIVASLPYLDLVATGGDWRVAQKAVALLDKELSKIVAAVTGRGGVLIISAAGGNIEHFRNLATELPDAAMTDNPVPFLIVGTEFAGKTIGLADPLNNDLSLLAPAGTLADIAPTVLDIMKLPKPVEMTGKSLIRQN